MTGALAASVLLILTVVATRLTQPADRARRQPPPALAARPAEVRPRHDHRDGGRGRLRPRRRRSTRQ